ncbi:unnamed protein product [Haemonchus placei]|uniref:7TM_GPCR_Srx domain-containing protein n=1 Tax=Haemonchus placei TaxID=6290 RepID=A0A0N4WK80_HAEPC|nr:unnamed protein product [Haemonchus placei]
MMGDSSPRNPAKVLPYFICDTMSDIVGLLLCGVTIYGVLSSKKIFPIFTFIATVFCSATSLLLLQDLGLNILLLDYLLNDFSFKIPSWQQNLSLFLAGLIRFVRFFLTMLQMLMTVNRLCAVLLVTRYQRIFTFRNTITAVVVFLLLSAPPLPIFIFRLGGCTAYFVPEVLGYRYASSKCVSTIDFILAIFRLTMFSIIITIDCAVCYIQYRRRNKNRNAQGKQGSQSAELQFVLMTVILAALSGLSTVLRKLVDHMDWITVGFINRQIRKEVLDLLCFWKRKQTMRLVTSMPNVAHMRVMKHHCLMPSSRRKTYANIQPCRCKVDNT